MASFSHAPSSSVSSSGGDVARRALSSSTRPATGGASSAQGSAAGGSPNPSSSQTTNAVPANSAINKVTYKQSTIKALIDPALPLADVVRQLCANSHLGVQEPPALFALRDEETEELVTDANMRAKISAGKNFRLCSSPTIEAVEMVEKLSSSLSSTSRNIDGAKTGQPAALSSSHNATSSLKLALYNLQRLVREKPFSDEFLKRGGLEDLLDIIGALEGGNMLAYALCCLANLMEARGGWGRVGEEIGRKVVRILATQERINVCRPATAILKRLVLSGPSQRPDKTSRSRTARSKAPASATDDYDEDDDDDIYRFGFEFVHAEIKKEPTFLNTLVQRLGSADTTLCLFSLSLITSLMRDVTDNLFEDFMSELDALGVSRAVARLMDSNRGDELSSSILEYQSNVIRVAHKRMRTTVTPTDKRHVSALSYIWLSARISDAPSAEASSEDYAYSARSRSGGESQSKGNSSKSASSRYKWRRLGFESENVTKEFSRTGWLGLMCCDAFVRSDPDAFAKTILEQINRPASRRCNWGQASLEVVEILSDHYDISSGFSTSTKFQPFLLSLPRLHALALRFFLRIWTESGAAASDFSRVSALVRSQVKEALKDEGEAGPGGAPAKSWLDVERDFVESEYRMVRDRQMRELEVDGDFGGKPSIRNLRGRLYRESYEFVRHQRIQCLLEGAWFRNPAATKFALSSGTSSGGGANGSSTGHAGGMSSGPGGLPISPSSSGTIVRGGRGGSSGGAGASASNAAATARPWRFYRLSPNRKFLHYVDAAERGPVRSGLDDLPERIDLSLVSDISLQSAAHGAAVDGAAPVSLSGAGSGSGVISTSGAAPGSLASLSFSLLRAPDVSLADFIALNQSQFSEWADGLSMLRGEAGVVSTKETADYIQILTEIGTKVKLLDLTGERIDVPTSVDPAPLPNSTAFFFADL